MNFLAFLWLISLTVLLPIVIVKMQTETKRRELAARQPGAADALTVGELRDLIRETVGEEVAPLAERLTALEQGALAHGTTDELPGEREGPEKSVGRRTPA